MKRVALALLCLSLFAHGCGSKRAMKLGLIISGSVVLGGGYAEAAISMGVSRDETYMIPVAGPLMAPDEDSEWYPLAILWGTIVSATQVIGLGLLIGGLSIDTSDEAPDSGEPGSSQAYFHVSPTPEGGMAGFGMRF